MENVTKSSANYNQIIIWVDVSKAKIDIFNSSNSQSVQVVNQCKEIKSFIKNHYKWSLNDYVFIFEPTWVYSQALSKVLNELWANYFQIWLDTIHKLWTALWDRNKTDRIDAKKIASVWKMLIQYSDDENFKIRKIKSVSNDLLIAKNLLSQLCSIRSIKRQLNQFIDVVDSQPFTKELAFVRKWQIKQINLIEKQEGEIINEVKKYICLMWYEQNLNCIKSIPWIAEEWSLGLTIFFIDLISKWIQRNEIRKVKAYTGLDPLEKESWTTLNKTSISKRWNKNIRSLIYMGTMTWLKLVKNEKHKDTVIWKFTQRSASRHHIG